MFARTENLLLRPGWAEDAPALARALRGVERSANAAADALADAESFLAASSDAILLRLLITLRTDGGPLVIGTVGLTRRASGHIELSCWIEETRVSKGYAAEAVRAVFDIAATLSLPEIEPPHFVDGRSFRPLLEVPLAA